MREAPDKEVEEGSAREVREATAREMRDAPDKEVEEGSAREVRNATVREVESSDRELREATAREVKEGSASEEREAQPIGLREGQSTEVREGQSSEVRKEQSREVRDGQSRELWEGKSCELREGQSSEVREGQSREVKDEVSNEDPQTIWRKIVARNLELKDKQSGEVKKGQSGEVREGQSREVKEKQSGEVKVKRSREVKKKQSRDGRDGHYREVREGQSSEVESQGRKVKEGQGEGFRKDDILEQIVQRARLGKQVVGSKNIIEKYKRWNQEVGRKELGASESCWDHDYCGLQVKTGLVDKEDGRPQVVVASGEEVNKAAGVHNLKKLTINIKNIKKKPFVQNNFRNKSVVKHIKHQEGSSKSSHPTKPSFRSGFNSIQLSGIKQTDRRLTFMCYYCKLCKMRFTRKSSLDRHKVLGHTMKCFLCNFKLPDKASYKEHMLNNHGISSNQPKKASTKDFEFIEETDEDIVTRPDKQKHELKQAASKEETAPKFNRMCFKCNLGFSSTQEFSNHKSKHHGALASVSQVLTAQPAKATSGADSFEEIFEMS